jgi:hypothetical protein
MIANFLINAVSFFVNHDKEKKDIIGLFKQHFSEEDYQLARADLFECLLQLPSASLYAGKFVHILHSVCEEIIVEEPLNTKDAYRKLGHKEDHMLGLPGRFVS